MLFAVISGMAMVLGAPSVLVVVALAVSHLPVAVVAVVVATASAIVAVRTKHRRSDAPSEEGVFLRRLAGRVSAGATIRSAIADPAANAVPLEARRLAALGMPMSEIGRALSTTLPVNGASFRAICSFSEHTGAAIASSLAVLAERSDEATEIARHRRVSLAQAKLSAVVVGVVPIVASTALIAIKGIPDPGGIAIVGPMAAGFALQVLGTLIVFRVAAGAA